MTAASLTGPTIAPRNGHAQAGHLVMILHGYGDSGAGILALGHEMQHMLPDDTAFVAPNALQVCDMFAGGYQWFPIRAAEGISTRAFDRKDVIADAHAALDAYIDVQLAHWGVDESKLAVIGFSQGAMMAMYTMPRRKKPCAAVVAYSGLLVDAAGLQAADIVKMPVLAVHGAADDVVPASCLDDVAQGFSAAGFDIETVLRPNVPHTIDQFGLIRGAEIINEQFDK